MADNRYISLKICGNQYANSGFMPLVTSNSPAFQVSDSEYSGFNQESYFLSVRIEPAQIVYTLVKNNVRSCNGALREGSLKIAIAVPKGYAISQGRSPYDALIKIKDQFLAKCMICKDPVAGIYEFTSGMIEPGMFDALCREFALEPKAGPYRPMTVGGPKGYILLSEESMRALLSDVQYVEFSPYSEVVVAQTVQNTNYTQIVNLAVPRPVRFRILIDGMEDGFVTDLSEEIPAKGRKDARYYDNIQVSFSVLDLRSGKPVPGVTLDEVNEAVQISSDALSVPKTVKVNIRFDGEAEGYFYSFKNSFQLTHRFQIISVNDYTFTLSGEKIAMLETPSEFRPTFSLTDKYTIEGCNLVSDGAGGYDLKIHTKKVVVAPMPPRDVNRPDAPAVYKVEIYLPTRTDYIHVYFSRKKIQTLSVNPVTSADSKYHCVIYIPDSCVWSSVEIVYEDSKCIYKSGLTKNNKTKKLEAAKFETECKSFYDRKIKPRKTLLTALATLLLGLVLGCVAGVYGLPLIQDKFQHERQPAVQTSNKLKCEYCGQDFASEQAMKSHIDTEHLKFDCDKCSERFLSEEELAAHKKTHRATGTATPAPQPQTHKCDKCDEVFDTAEELRAHRRTAGQYKCPICTAETGEKVYWHTQELLNKHMQEKHPDER